MPDLVTEALAILKAAKNNAADAIAAADRLFAGNPCAHNTAADLAGLRANIALTQRLHLQLAEMLIRIERRQKKTQSIMCFEAPAYWLYPAGGSKQGPYCPQCWETGKTAAPLHNVPFRGHDRWVCRVCAKTFFTEGAQAAMDAAERQADRR